MSTLSTSINNNINSNLNNDQKIQIKKTLKPSATEGNYTRNIQYSEIKNLYNKVDYSNLKGRKRYDNFQIFSMREKRLSKKKSKIKLNKKKAFSITKNYYNNLKTQNSIYITQNLSEGNFSQLPKILQKMETINEKKEKRNINNNKIKLNRKKEQKENISEVKTNPPMKVWLLNRLKHSVDNKIQNEEKRNRAKNNILIRKISDLNIYRKTENYYITYIHKIHDYLNKKKFYDQKKEKFLQFEELTRNQLESVKDKIKSIQKSQRLLDEKFIHKYQEYLTSLYNEKDKQEKKDILLCTKIYELRREVKILDNKIIKLMSEKIIYRKWLLFQVQVNRKLLRLPKEYQELLKIDKNKKLPNELMEYIKNIIYPTPQDLIKRIEFIENNNIKSLEIYHKITNEMYPLKDELEKEKNIFMKISDKEEINNLMELKLKLKAKNQILINKISSLKETNIFPKNNLQRKKYWKLYEKIKKMKINIFGKRIKVGENTNEYLEMLQVLKEIEIEIDFQKKKRKYYILNYKDALIKAKGQREKEKRIEKIRKNKNIVQDRQMHLRERIIEKANKKFLLPNMRINWTVYNIKKNRKKIFKINKPNEIKKENDFEYFCYE